MICTTPACNKTRSMSIKYPCTCISMWLIRAINVQVLDDHVITLGMSAKYGCKQ